MADNKSPCEKSAAEGISYYRPVVVVHGFLASGDTYALQYQRFSENCYGENYVFAFDWNSTGFGANQSAALDAFINDVLEETGADKVDLAGHSAGGGVCYTYLSNAAYASKVAHYVHIASSAQAGPAGPDGSIPTLNIWSNGDETVGGSDILGAENFMIPEKDHYQVATCEESFMRMYLFFNEEARPHYTGIMPASPMMVSGKTLTLGENSPINNALVEVYEVDPATGFRLNDDTPDFTFYTSVQGLWGPFEAVPGMYYEFFVDPQNGTRLVHYYREPFTRSNNLVYLRVFPSPATLPGILLASVPSDDVQTAMVVFASSQAMINGRDSLLINNTYVTTPEITPASKTAIALFAYDDGDGQSSYTPLGDFSFQFLTDVDIFIPTDMPISIAVTLNGRSLHLRNWPSATGGATIAVFD